MDLYKKAVKYKTKIQTTYGLLSAEQLFDLTIPELDSLAVSLEELVEKSPKKSFINSSTPENAKAKFKFDLVLDILQTKVKDQESANKMAETKAKRAKIAELIERKKDANLEEMSLEELEGMLEE